MKFDLVHKEITITQNIFLYQGFYTNLKILNSLKEKIIKNCISDNKNKTNVKGEMTSWNFFNQDSDFRTFIGDIIPDMRKCVGPQDACEIYNSWGNILNSEENYVAEHNHRQTTMLSGVLHLTEEGPGVYFKHFDYTLKEKIGGFALFHPETLHAVKKFKYKQPRVSLAFNLNGLHKGTR
tara:strand:+ start:3580 stop:4119 length:540 start_codon:yes stop_codon:yes gene_type:complete